MANSNAMTRADAAKNHIGGNMLMMDSAGDVGQTQFQGKIVAWVNFNGTGTVAVRGSANVSSISDGGTGDYTCNFTSNLFDGNCGVLVTSSVDGNYYQAATNQGNISSSSVRVRTMNSSGTYADSNGVTMLVVR